MGQQTGRQEHVHGADRRFSTPFGHVWSTARRVCRLPQALDRSAWFWRVPRGTTASSSFSTWGEALSFN